MINACTGSGKDRKKVKASLANIRKYSVMLYRSPDIDAGNSSETNKPWEDSWLSLLLGFPPPNTDDAPPKLMENNPNELDDIMSLALLVTRPPLTESLPIGA